MKFAISYVAENEALNEAKNIKSALIEKGFVYDEKEPELVISIGGDGTFLRTLQKYINFNPVYANINFGNLGYLCEYSTKEVDELINDIIADDKLVKEVSLLECEYNGFVKYAINEFRIEANEGGTLIFDVNINGTFLERIKGDGCLVSTSIGSSGMSRSLGGALVDNEIEMIQFVENAPINNRFYSSIRSPYVLNKDKKITIDNIKPNKFSLYYDCKVDDIKDFAGPVNFSISDKKIRFLKNKRNNYIKKTREAFLDD